MVQIFVAARNNLSVFIDSNGVAFLRIFEDARRNTWIDKLGIEIHSISHESIVLLLIYWLVIYIYYLFAISCLAEYQQQVDFLYERG